MTNKQKVLGRLAMLGLISNVIHNGKNEVYDDIHSEIKSNTPKATVIPKGCKQYYFDKYGWYRNEEREMELPIVYKCIASNNKTAVNKFSRWISTQAIDQLN